MSTDEDTAAGLIAWLNNLDVANDVQTVGDLVDGAVIWKALRESMPVSLVYITDQYRTHRCVELSRKAP
jgi:hypothetical protein